MINQETCLFLIIDIQEKLLNAVFNKELLERKAEILAKASSLLKLPVIVTEQYPQGLGTTIAGLKENLFHANFYEKQAFNALENEDLLTELNLYNKQQIVIFGIETHICVYQTVMSLLSKGFEITVIKDACGSRAKEEYEVALNTMQLSGVKIKTTEMLLFELLKSAKHPKFKEIQNLIK